MYYFAYGSNLHREQMKKRCPDSEPVAKVRLEGYRLCFNRVADIVEDEGSIVWGAIYTVSSGDIGNLDRYEGYPNFYDKLDVDVADDQGKVYRAFAYVMTSKGCQEPSDSYYRIIEEGYRNWDLDLEPLQQALIDSRQQAPFRPSGLVQPGWGRRLGVKKEEAQRENPSRCGGGVGG